MFGLDNRLSKMNNDYTINKGFNMYAFLGSYSYSKKIKPPDKVALSNFCGSSNSFRYKDKVLCIGMQVFFLFIRKYFTFAV